MTFDGDDTYTFSSGRKLYANRGILGIDPEGNTFDGYDSSWDERDFRPRENGPMTKEERHEIADEMIARWQRWKGQE